MEGIMNFEITEWFVNSFKSTVIHLVQQKTTRIWQFARHEAQHSKLQFFDIVGGTEVRKRTARVEDTPNMKMDHMRRGVMLHDYDWGNMVDGIDKIRMLNMPTSEYVIEAKNAFNRKKDSIMIDAFDAPVFEGEEGTTITQFPYATNANASSDKTDLTGGLTILGLRTLKKAFRKDEVLDEEGEKLLIHMAVSADELDTLLDNTEVTSADYNTVKALVHGDVDTFMGFKFHHTEQLNLEESDKYFDDTTGKYSAVQGAGAGKSTVKGFRKCVAWLDRGMINTSGEEVNAKITERDDKSYAVQAYVKMSHGSARLEDKLVRVLYVKTM